MIWPFKRKSPGGADGDGADALLRRGAGHLAAGRATEAEECFREVVAREPEHAEGRRQLGQLLAARGQSQHERNELEPALECYLESLALDPVQAPVLIRLGILQRALGRTDAAAAAFREAIALDDRYAEAHLQLGSLLRDAGDPAAAMASFRAALDLDPGCARACQGIAFLLDLEGDIAGALEHYRRAIALAPDYAEAHFNLGLLLLLRGEFEEGWREYEWRLRMPNFDQMWPEAAGPRWDGAPLEGRTILLFAEQGFGDVIQFIRYAPLVAARGGRVIVRCLPRLKPLLEGAPGIAAVHGTDAPLPAFDVCAFLLSLPGIFGTTLETIPARAPYLRPAADRLQRWKERLAADGPGFKVGLYWSTESNLRISSQRSLTLDQLAPLGAARGVRFYSLQRDAAAAQAATPPPGMALTDLSPELGGFADDAALMRCLDLTITINTATAHLAGAAGARAWVLIQHPPDWRWLLEREDSPWYPSLRLFRRRPDEGWDAVVARVAAELRKLA